MPSGDAQRVWFPAMLEELERTWSPSTSWEALVDFCQKMTELRRRIREAAGIRGPQLRCPRCGKLSQPEFYAVSIRSALYALRTLGLLTAEELRELDRSWKSHRAGRHLDAYGRSTHRVAADSDQCCRG